MLAKLFFRSYTYRVHEEMYIWHIHVVLPEKGWESR